jgi:hypothetical protein
MPRDAPVTIATLLVLSVILQSPVVISGNAFRRERDSHFWRALTALMSATRINIEREPDFTIQICRCAAGRMESFGSRCRGMKCSSRTLFWDRRSRGKRQPAAPEFPRAVVDSTGLGSQHYLKQACLADRLLQQKNVIVYPEVHRLGDDPIFGMRLSAHRFPPQVFLAELRDHIGQNVVCRHTP